MAVEFFVAIDELATVPAKADETGRRLCDRFLRLPHGTLHLKDRGGSPSGRGSNREAL